MTKRRAVLLEAALIVASVAPVFGAASIQITDPQDQDFVNTGGGAPAPVTVTYQVTGNTCTGFRSSFAVQPYVNGVPVLCSGSGCSCDGTIEPCNNITASVTLDGNDFDSCLNSIQLSLDPAPFVPPLCITPGSAVFSGTIRVWQDPYKGCTGLGGPGDGCNRPTVGGPVDVATGEMFYEATDFSLDGPLPIEIRRRYESHSTFSGPLTTGWTHNYLMRIDVTGGANRPIFIDEEGRSIRFAQNAHGSYGTSGIDQLTLTAPGSPAWRVTDKSQTRQDFDSSGRLTEIRNRNGDTLTFGYTGNNLTSITDIFGRCVTLTYDGSNRLQTIVAGTRTVTYTYVSGQLQRVDYPDGTFFTYEYNDPSDTDNLTAVKDSLGQIVESHVYDAQDKVTHTESDGANNSFDLVYDTATQTTVTNAGGIDTVYTHDSFSGLVTSSTGPGCAACGGGGDSATMTYDGQLNRITLVDGKGSTTRMTYDGRRNMLTKTEAEGAAVERTQTFTYHPTFNFVETASVPTAGSCGNPNRVITNTYEADGDLMTQVVIACNDAVAFSYTTSYTYDAHGQVLTVDRPRTDITDVTTFTYYADGDADPSKQGRLETITDPEGLVTTYNSYDLFGNATSISDPNNVETTYAYDGRDRLQEVSIKAAMPADDITTTYAYDVVGNLHTVRLPTCVDAGGSCVFSRRYIWDAVNRPTEIEDAVGNRLIYSYDTQSRIERVERRDPGNVLKFFVNFSYDSQNRLQYGYFTSIVPELPGSVFWKFGYDANGNLTTAQDPDGHVITFDYDELNRVTTRTEIVGGVAHLTQNTYNIHNGLESTTDPEGLVTTYLLGDLGWILGVTSPDTGTSLFGYDPDGNPTSSTDARGITVNRDFDGNYRLTLVDYPSDPDVVITYDEVAATFGKGRRTTMQDASGTTTYDYDLRGLVTGEERTISGDAYTTTYVYDKNGNLTDLFYPETSFFGRQGRAQYVYNQANQVTAINAEIGGALTSVATNLAYEPFGPLSGMTFGNGLAELRTHDTRYQLLNLSLGALLSFTHSYDDDGDLAGRVDNLDAGNNLAFAYDELHRLATAVGPWGPSNLCPGGVTYTYDRNGNRLCKGESGTATTYAYVAGTNRLDASAGGAAATFTHDAHGNVTSDGVHTYDFDDANHLEIVYAGLSETARYTYDGDNRRTTKLASGTTALYFHAPDGRLISEVTPGSASGREYVYLDEMPVARVDWSAEANLGDDTLFVSKSSPDVQLDWSSFPAGSNEYVVRRKTLDSLKTFANNAVIANVTDPQQTYDDPVLNDGQSYLYRVFLRSTTENLFFYHVDHLGTPEAMTNGSGALVWRAQHRPFGEILTPTVETVTDNLRLPGQYFDAETDLFQNWHRDYDPGLGRYREPDPLGLLKDPQLYPYVGNNPTNWVDVLGLYRRGDVIYRVDPKNPDSADVTFVWDDPTPDIDGNGDEIILAFGNPKDCPDTCSDKARMMQINSEADPYRGWKITGDWKPGWWWRSSDGTYQRRWRAWQRRNPSWTPPAELGRGVKGVQCYNLVNYMTGKGDRLGLDNIFDLRAPRDLRYWRRKTQR